MYSLGKTDEKVSVNNDVELLEIHHSDGDHLQLSPQPKRINEILVQTEEATLNYCVSSYIYIYMRMSLKCANI